MVRTIPFEITSTTGTLAEADQISVADGQDDVLDGHGENVQAVLEDSRRDIDSADAKAVAADRKAVAAQTAATTADAKAVTADGKAVTADGKAVAAQTAANNADAAANTNAGAIGVIDGRVSALENAPVQDISGIGANAAAITAVDGRVTVLENAPVQDISGIARNATAITAVDGRVTTAEGKITALENAPAPSTPTAAQVTVASGTGNVLQGHGANVQAALEDLRGDLDTVEGRGGNDPVTFDFDEIYSSDLNIVTANRFIDTGWDIPATGNAVYQFRMDDPGEQANAADTYTHLSSQISADDLRGLPVSTVNARSVSNQGISLFPVIGFDFGSLNIILARTSTNDLLITSNNVNIDPMPLIIRQMTGTGTVGGTATAQFSDTDKTKLEKLASDTTVDSDAVTFNSDVSIDPANVKHSENALTGTPLNLVLNAIPNADGSTAKTAVWNGQNISYAALAGGTLTLQISAQPASAGYSGFPPVLKSLELNFDDEEQFMFPLDGLSAIDGNPIKVSIKIPTKDYDDGADAPADITLAYDYEGQYYHGSLTIHSVVETRDGPLRSAIEAIAFAQARLEAAKLQVEIDKLRHELDSTGQLPSELSDRISPLVNIDHLAPETGAYFSTGLQPASLAAMTQVSVDNPRFTMPSAANLYVAVAEPGDFVLLNITAGTQMTLAGAVGSFFVDGKSHFLYSTGPQASGAVFEVEDRTVDRTPLWEHQIQLLTTELAALKAAQSHVLDGIPEDVLEVMKNDVQVTVQDTVTRSASDFNNQLGNPDTQESVSDQQGTQASNISDAFNQRASGNAYRRKKLIYMPGASALLAGQNLLAAMVGGSTNILMTTDAAHYFGKRHVAAIPGGSQDVTVYPAPANEPSREGKFIEIAASTIGPDGAPIPEADEKFFTRNIPGSSRTLTIEYRGTGNSGYFGRATTTLVGVGGPVDVSKSVVLVDGAETVTLFIDWIAATRRIRASIAPRTNYSATVRSVGVNLRFTETRTLPATPATVRDVQIGTVRSGETFVVALSADSVSGNVILTTAEDHLDTGYSFADLFGSGDAGHIAATGNDSVIYDYRGFDATEGIVGQLVARASLKDFGLFDTDTDHRTTVNLETRLQVKNSAGETVDVGAASAPSGGGGPTYDNVSFTGTQVSMTPKSITMPRVLGDYMQILLKLDVDLHLAGTVDVHQLVVPIYPTILMGNTGIVDLDIAKAGGSGGLAISIDQADFSSTSKSFIVSLIQLLDSGTISSGFRIIQAQGIRF